MERRSLTEPSGPEHEGSNTIDTVPIALLAAGGEGRRLGATGPKALVECAGRPLLAWSLTQLARSTTFGDGAGLTVVAGHRDALGEFGPVVDQARDAGLRILLCGGGASRSHSVRAALVAAIDELGVDRAVAGASDEAVLVHDSARPLATGELFDGIARALVGGEARCLVAAAPVVDTIKLVGADRAGSDLVVEGTPPRDRLWAVQTPQAFKLGALTRALGLASDAVSDETLIAASDDASLVERRGERVAIYPWREENFKVTTAEDLARASRLLGAGA